MRILMVENERVIANQVAKLLVEWGHQITYCGNDGRQLLERVGQHPPDLVLTGFFLKGEMGGGELIDRLWTRWDIPVVVLSGMDAIDLPATWKKQRGLFFLAKPFLPHQLRLIIDQAVASALPLNLPQGPIEPSRPVMRDITLRRLRSRTSILLSPRKNLFEL